MSKTIIALIIVIAVVVAGGVVWLVYSQNSQIGTMILKTAVPAQNSTSGTSSGKTLSRGEQVILLESTSDRLSRCTKQSTNVDDGKTGNQICQSISKTCQAGTQLSFIHSFSSTNGTCSGKVQDINIFSATFPCDTPHYITPGQCSNENDSSSFAEPAFGDQQVQSAAMYTFFCCDQ